MRSTKTAAAAKPKANILGAKKKGLGAKKVVATGGDALDFEEMERKAKEEAERIEKLGYDAEAERAAAEESAKAKEAESRASIVSPTPVSPRGGFGSTGKERNSGDVERLGMGVARLGFGQVAGGSKPAAVPKKMGGFGATSRAADDGTLQLSDGLRGSSGVWLLTINFAPQSRNATLARSSARKRASRPTSSSAAVPSIPARRTRPRRVSKVSRALPPSAATRTSGVPRTKVPPSMITATLRPRRRTSCASSVSRLAMIWIT